MFKEETILFDLDGTLLPIDMDYFLKLYFKTLTDEFSDLEEPDRFIDVLMKSTQHMIENDGERTNEEVFKDSFFSMLKVDDIDQTMERFDKFYEEKYPQIKNMLDLKTRSPELIKLLLDKDYQLVIATNPLFPYKAIEERIKWAGLDPEDFAYITCYEEMHYSKPSIGFYKEILDRLNLNPAECAMVGNDVQEDMIAGELGLSTYLIEDYKIDRNKGDFKIDWKGSMEQLISQCKKRVSI